MKEIQSLLKIVSDGLKTIAQGIEAVSDKVDEVAESQSAVQAQTGAKPKAKKSATTAAAKKKPVRKTAAKKSPKKAASPPTAVETVFKIISRSKKGVDVATLMKKTGYDRKKVSNVIYKLGKQGKIKSIDKGVYVKA
jgi:predicted Rossmann fold nucleotide-binding protein DprA/Smf involved in DNA uptake